jgi:hypothetical protein
LSAYLAPQVRGVLVIIPPYLFLNGVLFQNFNFCLSVSNE